MMPALDVSNAQKIIVRLTTTNYCIDKELWGPTVLNVVYSLIRTLINKTPHEADAVVADAVVAEAIAEQKQQQQQS